MKAIVYENYGPPDVLQLRDVEKPTPKDNEVLIKIQAAAITFGDLAAVKGEPLLVRLSLGLRKPKYQIHGTLPGVRSCFNSDFSSSCSG